MNKKLILHIEDNPVNRDATSVLLERYGFSVISEANGNDGIATAKSQHPDLILMDIRMPIMNGLKATELLKKDPATSHILVVVLTAYSIDPGNRKNCLAAGCVEYLLKPVDITVLVEIINRYMH